MRIPLRYSLRSVVQRRTRSLLTALGVATAVFLSVGMIALSRGLVKSALGTAHPLNAVVLSKGAESMEFSAVEPSAFQLLAAGSQIEAREGEPLASPEAYLSTFIRFQAAPELGERRGVVRGVRPVALRVHDMVRIASGRAPARGFEVAVGRLAATKLGVPSDALAVGRVVEFEGQRWTVVGVIEAPGTVFESEVWGDLDDVLVASKRNDFSAVAVRTKGESDLEDFFFDVATRTDVRLDAKSEASYYEALARSLEPVRAASAAMTVILVLGALMAGANTMFTSVLGRTREMAVLIVLGYRRRAVLASFALESLGLCLLGGLAGVGFGALLDGFPMKVPMGAFRFSADLWTLSIGLCLAAAIGILGAVAPVLRVARLSTVSALRAE